ncbi:MAG: arginase family protein [Actinomycetota bacterium]|nr:arginase family protein [Actinomycetota bacterium]
MQGSRWAIIEAPSVLGLFPSGVERLPDALLEAGIADRIGARRAGRVAPPQFDPKRDPATGLLNPQGLRDYAHALAGTVGSVVDRGETPLVLGGDCSILLGPLLAMGRRGRYGLMFLDGHADFYQPEPEPNGEAASMDLALVTGRGPRVVADLEGLGPLVRDEDVAVLGRRDAEEASKAGSQRIEGTLINVIDLPAVRRLGVGRVAGLALDGFEERELDGFWIEACVSGWICRGYGCTLRVWPVPD